MTAPQLFSLTFVSKPFVRNSHAPFSLALHRTVTQMSSNTNENNGDSSNITNSNPNNLSNNDGRQIVTTIDGNSLNSSQVPTNTFPSNSRSDQQLQEQPAQGLDQPGASAPTPVPELSPVAPAPSSEHPMAFPSAPPVPQDSPPSDVPSAQIAPTQTASGAVPTDHPNPSRAYWCHEVCHHLPAQIKGVQLSHIRRHCVCSAEWKSHL